MYYLFTHFQTFSKFLSQFLPLQVEETYFFQEAIAVSCFTLKEHVNSNAIVEYLYSAHFAVVSLVLRITASCKGKYLLNHGFQPFFQFFPVSSTSGGRNLFLPGRFKPGFNPVSSTRWKKPANPALTQLHWIYAIRTDAITTIKQTQPQLNIDPTLLGWNITVDNLVDVNFIKDLLDLDNNCQSSMDIMDI